MFTKEGNLATIGRRRLVFPLFITILVVLLAGCEGDLRTSEQGVFGGGESISFPAKILTWSPPTQYTNGTPLDPVTGLDRFEIYINEDGIFSDTDNEMAAVSAIDSGTGQPVTSFNLANLAPFLSQGVTYHVSIRAVSLAGMKSSFSPGATFSF